MPCRRIAARSAPAAVWPRKTIRSAEHARAAAAVGAASARESPRSRANAVAGDLTLSNGVRLIVQPETITHTVVVRGEILNNPGVQEPPGQEGVADLTSDLLPFGTTTYDRVGFQRELDAIAASTTAGTDFGLDVLSADLRSRRGNCWPTKSCIRPSIRRLCHRPDTDAASLPAR